MNNRDQTEESMDATTQREENMEENMEENIEQSQQTQQTTQLDEDEEFDDFNGPEDDSDSEFGTFENDTQVGTDRPDVSMGQFMNNNNLEEKVSGLVDQLFPMNDTKEPQNNANNQLLNERSQEIFNQLSRLPHLKPRNWVKLKIRFNLLIKLGIPINLDEIADEKHPASSMDATNTPSNNHPRLGHNRRRSINEGDINWTGFEIPEFQSLSLNDDDMKHLLHSTNDILSTIENDNLNNSSQSYLELCDQDKLIEKLTQFQRNYLKLVELASIWSHHFHQCKENFEIFESVVQNLIAYSQKLERDEILINLNKAKAKSKKKSLWR